jgi:Bacterial Ig-like domain
MNKQINAAASQTTAVQPAALEIKGATTMNKIIRNSLTITAFAALALVFGACSQPDVASNTDQAITPNITAATDVISDASADTPASAEDLQDVITPDVITPGSSVGADSNLQAQGGDKVAPVLYYNYPTSGGTTAYNYASPYLEFSEKMKHDSIKNAFKVVVTPPSGPSYNAKGTFYWIYNSANKHESFWFYPNKVYAAGSLVSWKINKDAKDLAGNRLFAGRNGTFRFN